MKNKNYIIIINGLAQSGKSTFASLVKKYCETLKGVNSTEVSTIDYIKRIFQATTGWNGKTKSTKVRQALHDLKQVYETYNNSPNKEALIDTKTFIEQHPNDINIIFVNIRESSSIKKFITLVDKEDYIIIKLKVVNSNIDSNEPLDVTEEINKTEYDVIINNDGKLKDLQKKAIDFVETLRNEN